MNEVPLWGYPLVFLGSVALALLFTPIALHLALRRGILDHPGAIKAQSTPVPYLGGAAIVVSFAVAVVALALIRPPVSGLGQLTALLAIAVALALMGLIDDLRGLSPTLRLGLQVAAGLGVWACGVEAHLFGPDIADAAVTVLWVVAVTNAFNLLDNMDGLSAGVAAIASVFLFIVAYLNGQFLVATLAIALAGVATGFLRHNFQPARIYMGDAGSLFLGFLLAVLSLKLRTRIVTRTTFLVPMVILGVALFDTTLVTVTRLIHHRSPMMGGRDHTSHRLVHVGIPVRATVGLIYAACVALGWLGLVMSRLDRSTSFILMGLVLAVALFLGVLLALVPVYDTSRRRHLAIREVTPEERHQRDAAVGCLPPRAPV
ncbi:MAG TPA: MraY family glycosyltransferase [Acidimicrobiales bacterium]|nr:MraY family glycosyltransferase [Acidimicrobiales bacterium]